MKGTVLLTGASGFVGRQVFKALVHYGLPLCIVIRKEEQKQFFDHKVVQSIIKSPDIFCEDQSWWADKFKGVDTVIHVAWYAEPGHYLQSPVNIDCLKGTLVMAKGAVKAGIRRFIGIGTCFEYDLRQGFLSVDTPLSPTTPYAAAKAAVFFALSAHLPLAGVEFAWCRLFYLFGDNEDERRFVPYLRKQLAAGKMAELTSGRQIRDFMDVEAAGKMIVETALNKVKGAVNICSGVPISVRQLAEQIADEYGRRDLLRFGVRPDNLVDPPCVVGIKS